MADAKLTWQSKLILLAVLPFVATEAVLECHRYATRAPSVAAWTVGLSGLLGLATWAARAATPMAALTGALITTSLMFATVDYTFEPWRTALIPVLVVALLAFAATRIGRRQKERMGTAERRHGRSAAQVAANLGVAALVSVEPARIWLADSGLVRYALGPMAIFTVGLAALAEAAADTVSSEIGQVLGGRPRMVTTFKTVEPGRDGAVSVAGCVAGIGAAAVVAGAGVWAMRGGWELFWISGAGAVFGLFFDSLLGATLEERGWLNNDAVNFLSTASAAGFALLLLAASPHAGVR